MIAKGKGELETYWLRVKNEGPGSASDSSESEPAIEYKDQRIVDWNVALLETRLKGVVAHRLKKEASEITLDLQVLLELKALVLGIAHMYNSDNPFHNFLHASHVTMAVTKMLSRVVISEEGSASAYARGITDDPLTHFAVVFGSLIHDGKCRL